MDVSPAEKLAALAGMAAAVLVFLACLDLWTSGRLLGWAAGVEVQEEKEEVGE